MTEEIVKEPEFFDQKDKQILLILQDNGRESLTNIAKKVGLSIDSVKARIEKLHKKGIIDRIKALLVPRNMGYPLVADIKIKLHNNTQETTEQFIAHLKNHPRVIDLLSLMGDYDLTCVLIAKNPTELETIQQQIRQKFNTIIADWRGFLILKVHKFEEYALEQIPL
ncbi:putative HTH-type transcriptional regulator [uncultured archaeon]|nr:putative HTH-type transcriptional regulator [uncultured archaeon]